MNKENSLIMVNGGTFFQLPHAVTIDPELIYDNHLSEYRIAITFLDFDEISNSIRAFNALNMYANDFDKYGLYEYGNITVKTGNYLISLDTPKILRTWFNGYGNSINHRVVYDIWVNTRTDVNYKGFIYENDEVKLARSNS